MWSPGPGRWPERHLTAQKRNLHNRYSRRYVRGIGIHKKSTIPFLVILLLFSVILTAGCPIPIPVGYIQSKVVPTPTSTPYIEPARVEADFEFIPEPGFVDPIIVRINGTMKMTLQNTGGMTAHDVMSCVSIAPPNGTYDIMLSAFPQPYCFRRQDIPPGTTVTLTRNETISMSRTTYDRLVDGEHLDIQVTLYDFMMPTPKQYR